MIINALSFSQNWGSRFLVWTFRQKVRIGEADAEPENVMTEVQTKMLSQQCSESDCEEDPEEDQENGVYEEIDEDPEDVMNEEPDEVSDLEIYAESDEDPVDAIVESSEEEAEEEINQENDCEPEDMEYEEPGENSEEEMDEEPEEDSEEEIFEDFEEDSAEEINDESDKEEQVVEHSSLFPSRDDSTSVKDLGHKLNDMVYAESGNKVVAINKSGPISDGTSATSEFDGKIGLPSVLVNGDCASNQQEPGTSSRKHRHSRWDLRPEEETLSYNETSKRRKTRWDNGDSRKFLCQVSSSLEVSKDQEILRLKERLTEINKMLQSSDINGKEPAEEISHPKPDNNSHGMKMSGRAQRKLKKSQRNIISQLAKLYCRTPFKFIKKVFVPVGEYPTYKFIGLILGPRGNTQKRMEKETGAKILIRGKGSGAPSEDEELHVLVEADNQLALNAAVDMVEQLLIPVADQNNEHKKAQLTELATLRRNHKDHNTCPLCKEHGHIQYACPLKDSTFNAACCGICGSFDHPTSKCKSNKEVDNLTLYVGYLPQVTDEKRLKELFLPFGKIIKTAVIKDPTTGLSKGYGFVQFDNSTDASAAITYMNGYKMDGKVLAVRLAGQKPVPSPPPMSVPSVIYGQTTSNFGPVPTMFPEAQVSISGRESLYFPFSSGNVARTVGLTIHPYAATSTIYPRTNNYYFPDPKFSCQATSSFSNAAISQFHGNPDTGSFHSYLTSSQFNPRLTNPALDEFQTFGQMTETAQNYNFGQGS